MNRRAANFICFFAIFIIFFIVSCNPLLANNFEENSGLSNTGAGAGYLGFLKDATPVDFYGILIKAFLGFLGIIFLLLMIYAGFVWMMARGNQAEVDKAKKLIESAIIGLVIVLAAYAITMFVGWAFEGAF